MRGLQVFVFDHQMFLIPLLTCTATALHANAETGLKVTDTVVGILTNAQTETPASRMPICADAATPLVAMNVNVRKDLSVPARIRVLV